MLEITYKGANAVIISTKKSTLMTDPKLSLLGLKDLPVKDAIEVLTEDRFAVNVEEASVLIDGPGEYEAGDFMISAAGAKRHIDTEGKLTTFYRIVAGEIIIGLLGNITAELTEEQLEQLGVIDILLLPVGGSGYTLDATEAVKLVRQIEPKIVIPIHYADSGLKYEVPQEGLDRFVTELAVEPQHEDRLKLKNASGLPTALTMVVLKRS